MLRVDCRLEANQKICLSSPSGAGHSRREASHGCDGVGGPVRQMCVSVTDAFWVSRLRWVTDTWRTNISPSKKCTSILMLCLFQSMSKRQTAEPEVAFRDNTSGEDLGEDNDVVITCAKLELWMLNEL